MEGLGKWLIAGGILLILFGVLAQTGLLSWLGRLPGDIRIERPGFSLYLPVTSMIIVSLLLSIMAQLLRRFF